MNHPSVSANVDQIIVQKGEVLTVYLNKADRHQLDSQQIELRVLSDGTQQMFVCKSFMKNIKTFNNWDKGE